jgi:hypothetical protein
MRRIARILVCGLLVWAQVHLLWSAELHRHEAAPPAATATELRTGDSAWAATQETRPFCLACLLVRQGAARISSEILLFAPIATRASRTVTAPRPAPFHFHVLLSVRAPPA